MRPFGDDPEYAYLDTLSRKLMGDYPGYPGYPGYPDYLGYPLGYGGHPDPLATCAPEEHADLTRIQTYRLQNLRNCALIALKVGDLLFTNWESQD